MVRWLREQGLEAGAFTTEYGDDAIEADAAEAPSAAESAVSDAR
jgi:putative mRNA 3-end processing factor